jgi:hypothetical protein
VSAFLAVCFELLDLSFLGLTVCNSIYGVSSRQEIDEKRPVPVPKIFAMIFLDVWCSEIFHFWRKGGANALIAI